jgi:hypothetical protein
VPTADGGAAAIVTDEHHNPDLLWALRGAGNGNFGVVTALTYRIHPLPQAVYVVATWPGLDDLPAVFDAWQRWAPHTDNRVTSQLEIGVAAVALKAVLASDSEAEALQLLQSPLSVGDPEVITHVAPWAQIYADFQIPLADDAANWKYTSQFITEPYPPEAVAAIRSFMAKAPTPECNYFTNAFGGAVVTGEPGGGSVFAHRDALFYAEPGAGWGVRGAPPVDTALTQACLTWLAEFSEALQPFVNGAYVNVPNAGIADWETAYWRSNVERLRAVKAAYDPDNVFTFEQGIQA